MFGCYRVRRWWKCMTLIFPIMVFHLWLLSYLITQTDWGEIKKVGNAAPMEFAGTLEHILWSNCSECYRFHQLMTSWPDSKPKAVIYFLTQPNVRTGQTREMMTSLFKYFNDKFRYPVIIFHTGDMTNETEIILSEVQSRELIFIQEITFEIPKFFPEREKIYCPGSLGYRHMCRFHANTVYLHPIMQDLEYAWRLDDDSLLLGPAINYDVFAFMEEHQLIYGYRFIDDDWESCVIGLWEAVYGYRKQNSIDGQFIDKWWKPKMFYNNFEISRVSFWMSEEYRRFITYIDRVGGLYQYRWGDAPIKSLALALFVSPVKILKFDNIGYRHQKKRLPGRSITPKPRFLYEDLRR